MKPKPRENVPAPAFVAVPEPTDEDLVAVLRAVASDRRLAEHIDAGEQDVEPGTVRPEIEYDQSMGRTGISIALTVGMLSGCRARTLETTQDSEGGATGTTTGPANSDGVGGSTSGLDSTRGGSSGEESTGDRPPACVPEISFGPFEPLMPEYTSSFQPYDIDGDGGLDLYTSNGFIIYVHDDGLEFDDTLAGPTGAKRVGHFDGTTGLDLIRTTPHRIDLFSGLAIDEPFVDTIVADVNDLDVDDTDADGIDDLLLGRQAGEQVQLWMGTESGVFELSQEFDAGFLTSARFARVAPPRLDIVLADGESVRLYAADGRGAFSNVQSIGALSVGNLAVIPSPAGDWVATDWNWTQLSTNSGVSLITFPGGEDAAAFVYGLSPEIPGDLTGADVDGDGIPEVFVEVTEGRSAYYLDVVCRSGDALVRCGRVARPEANGRLAIIERVGQPFVVHSLHDDGTSVAAIEVTPCP